MDRVSSVRAAAMQASDALQNIPRAPGAGAPASTEHPSNLATTAQHLLADCLSLETQS
jgi:hypothetical protein